MRNAVIWGTGQGGRMIRNLLQAGTKLVAFSDNNKSLWDTIIDGISVVPPERLSHIKPDCIYFNLKQGCIKFCNRTNRKTGNLL